MEQDNKRVRTVVVRHPHHAHKEIEIDYIVPNETLPIKVSTTNESSDEQDKDDDVYNLKKEKYDNNNNDNDDAKKPDDVVNLEPVEHDNARILQYMPSVYRWYCLYTSALSLDDGRSLLRNPMMPWNQQFVVSWYEQFFSGFVVDEALSKEDDLPDNVYDAFLSIVFSAATMGAMFQAHETSRVSERGITLRDILRSADVAFRFAELAAALQRRGAGGSAQPGRLYTGGGGGDRLALNIHSGMKHRRFNARVIQNLVLRFAGLQKYGDGRLEWSLPPAIVAWQRQQQCGM